MKTQKGITLIALIITIIVMLILVGVSVSVALNTGLFKTTQGVAKNTQAERMNETKLSSGEIVIKEKTYDSLESYVQKSSKIKFTIDSKTYYAAPGTKWSEWFTEETREWPGKAYNGIVGYYDANKGEYNLLNNNETVSWNAEIIEGAEYVWKLMWTPWV